VEHKTKLIAHTVPNDNIWQLGHHSLCSRIHEVQSAPVIRLLESVLVRESTLDNQYSSRIQLEWCCVVLHRIALLVEASPVDTDHDPSVGEQDVGLLERLDVLIYVLLLV
jgi:hypothetical protein